MPERPTETPERPAPETGVEGADSRETGLRGLLARFRGWPRAARWASYVAAALALLLVVGLVTAAVVVRRPLPQTDGEIAVPGLGAEVEVLRDANGIAQVYADTSEDLFFAQGFVHAQDRFFEMDFRRHVTGGRLAELLGEDALETDMYVRTMGWRRVAEEEMALLSPDTLRYLESYSAGVNAYLEEHSVSEMGLEYSVLALNGLDYTPEPWSPVDSVAWLKAMAWDLRGNMNDEIDRALAAVDHTAQEIEALYPDYPYDRHRPIVEGGGVVDGVFEQDASGSGSRLPSRPVIGEEVADALRGISDGVRRMPDLVGKGSGIGSNSWVVSGEHTETGEPMLANDPHLGVSVPGIWYQMGLHCRELSEACPFDVSGFTFSGTPGVVIGHNQEIAWGFTNLGPDVVDLYLEKVEGDSYLYDGRLRRLAVRDEEFKVLGRDETVEITVRSTPHGPLLSDVSEELSRVGANAPVTQQDAPERENGYAVALAWTALTPAPTGDAIFELGRATDWEEFRDAARKFSVPAQNLVYADKQGNIGYQAPGRVPIRKPGHDGLAPVPGWLPAYDWTGNDVPFDALPSVLNPDEGWIATANQAVAEEDYPFFLGEAWDSGYRSQRIVDLITARIDRGDRLSVEDMAAMQLDDRNGMAPTFVPYLLDILLPSEYYSDGQRLLGRWDYHQPADSAAAAYYNAVWRNTLRLTFHDQMDEALYPDGGSRWFEVMRVLLEDPTNSWWDDVETETVIETRDDILMRALQDARDELVQSQARLASEWTWGHHHRLDLESQTLGQSGIAPIEALFNRGGYAVGGGDSLVNATGWTAPDGYAVDWAPSMRMVVSLADFDASRWINLTGVSGHPFSPHYVDQTDLWVEGETLPWHYGRDAVTEAAEDTLTLTP